MNKKSIITGILKGIFLSGFIIALIEGKACWNRENYDSMLGFIPVMILCYMGAFHCDLSVLFTKTKDSDKK